VTAAGSIAARTARRDERLFGTAVPMDVVIVPGLAIRGTAAVLVADGVGQREAAMRAPARTRRTEAAAPRAEPRAAPAIGLAPARAIDAPSRAPHFSRPLRKQMDLLRILLAILLPPLGVFLQVGIGAQFWINILLTLLGYIPGIVHAVWIIARR
jgi:uncharacterized membrane protein YqaE (UPF0057 family)